ncbi:unnamed protein product [Arabidopsis arenosa]|uniref:KIB1-4 beta-propeller domain-containing protein n=1 Tax=Arabidopsis arenosa TaxID=38785 RepID=A0A8S2A5Q3_ARAAE|nr:unnamed protein product [Arabidopsis arenosa]
MMFTKSGFDNWREIPTREGPEILHGCQDLVYKYNKLYVLSEQNRIRILDFSQELPRANSDNVYHNPFKNDGKGRAMIIGVTVSGDVLIVKNQLKKIFNIFKMGLEGTRWDRVKSLGDESWIADLGVTVRASVNGTKPNSVYYCRDMNVYCGDISTRSQVIQKYFTSLKLGCVRFIRNDEFEYFLELYGTKFLLTWNDFRFEKTAILWVNGRNGDYIVAWAIKQFYIFSYKKIGNDDVGDGDGDKRWSITCTQCEDMAYKDNKLYVYTFDHYINIFDFCGDYPKEAMEENPYLSHPFRFVDTIYKLRLAVTRAGEVLIVLSLVGLNRKFCIYKLNLKIGDWEIVESLGDEMLIFGHGVTLRAPGKDISGGGLKSDSICFLYDDHLSDHHLTMKTQPVCGVFDLATSTITWHTRLEDLSSKICWFVPGYA